MIKALIIEDNIEKLRSIANYLQDVCSVREDDISSATNINDGRDLLLKNQYELLLLDLVLPINEGEHPLPQSGTDFLDEIYYNPNVNIPVHIIGLTEFDNIFRDNKDSFEDKLWGLIKFSLTSSDWQTKLRSKVFYLQSFQKKFQEVIKGKDKYDFAIVTALNAEFLQVIKTSEWVKVERENDQMVYYSTVINTKNNNNRKVIACCINQMGMQASASVGSKVISSFTPSILFMTGICAGLKSSGVNIGDIIVAKQCWDYESGKITEDASGELLFRPDMSCIPADVGIISKLSDFSNNARVLSKIYSDFSGQKPDTHLKVTFGSIGSGPYVLSSKNYLNKLIESDRKLSGIDMEGYGIFKAAQFHIGTIPIFVKAISDFGDEHKNDNYQDYASFVSAKFIMDFIYNYY
jgi:nucleoside phosphorylase/CheY-like chemotaxis protein